MKVAVSDLAHLDLHEIENYYFERGEHLPVLFYNEFEDVLIFIGDHPNTGFRLKNGYRLFQMKQFPHLIICQVSKDVVEVIHVFHPKRHPNLRFTRLE